MPAREPDSIVIGRLGAPYGIKGWLKIQSYTQPAENITRYSPWLIDGDPVTPQRVQRHNNGFIVQLPGVDDRDAASRWTGKNVAMNPTQLPVTEDDEYYWHELIGAQVVDAADSEVGRGRRPARYRTTRCTDNRAAR